MSLSKLSFQSIAFKNVLLQIVKSKLEKFNKKIDNIFLFSFGGFFQLIKYNKKNIIIKYKKIGSQFCVDF